MSVAPALPPALVTLDEAISTIHALHPIPNFSEFDNKRAQVYSHLPAADDHSAEAELLRKRVQHHCCCLAWEYAGRTSAYNPGQWAADPSWHATYNAFASAMHYGNPGRYDLFSLS